MNTYKGIIQQKKLLGNQYKYIDSIKMNAYKETICKFKYNIYDNYNINFDMWDNHWNYYCYKNGEVHRDGDKPAMMDYYKNDNIRFNKYYKKFLF